MSSKKLDQNIIDNMFKLITSVSSTDDCKDLFNDLCTNKEIEQMAQRIYAAQLLINGNTYNQVTEATDISSATLSRVSRCVQYGKGYVKFLSKE